MRSVDLKVGKKYRGLRHSRVGQSHVRELTLISRDHEGFAPMAHFIQRTPPMKCNDIPQNGLGSMTLKSFAQWAVSEIEDTK